MPGYINKGIRENKKLSVNVVDESWLKDADRMGTISGNKVDKSDAFAWTMGENGTPLIDNAKVSIECEVDGNDELEHFDHFICKILATYADEAVLNEKGKIDYHTFKPVLFEFPTYEYFVTGEKGGDYEIGAVFDALGIRPNIQYTVKEDQTLLAMVSNGLGISIMPELMVRRSAFPVVQCRMEKTFSRTIGICVKNKNACSVSTLRFIEHVQRWVTANYGT